MLSGIDGWLCQRESAGRRQRGSRRASVVSAHPHGSVRQRSRPVRGSVAVSSSSPVLHCSRDERATQYLVAFGDGHGTSVRLHQPPERNGVLIVPGVALEPFAPGALYVSETPCIGLARPQRALGALRLGFRDPFLERHRPPSTRRHGTAPRTIRNGSWCWRQERRSRIRSRCPHTCRVPCSCYPDEGQHQEDGVASRAFDDRPCPECRDESGCSLTSRERRREGPGGQDGASRCLLPPSGCPRKLRSTRELLTAGARRIVPCTTRLRRGEPGAGCRLCSRSPWPELTGRRGRDCYLTVRPRRSGGEDRRRSRCVRADGPAMVSARTRHTSCARCRAWEFVSE